jgi:hypothetical protein
LREQRAANGKTAYHACDKRLTGSDWQTDLMRHRSLIFKVLQHREPAIIPGMALALPANEAPCRGIVPRQRSVLA